jgi:hypothetical protein
MKLLISTIALILLLVGMSFKYIDNPKFKVGDCLVYTIQELEEWEKKQPPDYIIREIGKNNYRAQVLDKDILRIRKEIELNPPDVVSLKIKDQLMYQKVDCGNIK